jgi:hypothetical protein
MSFIAQLPVSVSVVYPPVQVYVTGATYTMTAIGYNYNILCNRAGVIHLDLPDSPLDAQSVMITDISGACSANPITVDGNGNTIAGVANVTINTDGDTQRFLFSTDLGYWAVI